MLTSYKRTDSTEIHDSTFTPWNSLEALTVSASSIKALKRNLDQFTIHGFVFGLMSQLNCQDPMDLSAV